MSNECVVDEESEIGVGHLRFRDIVWDKVEHIDCAPGEPGLDATLLATRLKGRVMPCASERLVKVYGWSDSTFPALRALRPSVWRQVRGCDPGDRVTIFIVYGVIDEGWGYQSCAA